ncbi:MAG: flagellin lysine-N-methylase [Clostridia bacterium]|nr:flagellin lysine-N-methylase [Clostridia bacterium]
MKTTRPDYYDKFKCIADRCRDSCCIGWEIDIDPETLKIYEHECGTLGEKLKKNIKDGSFVLTEDERCPFLKADGLCELICRKGEGYLCEICAEHPRYYEHCGEHLDMGIGLCCEEACRLLFCENKPLGFITEGEGELDDETAELLQLRKELTDKIQDESSDLEKMFFSLDGEIFELWDSFEPYDNRWTKTSAYIKEHFGELVSLECEFNVYIGKRSYEYRRLAVYLLHRYFMRAAYCAPSVILRGISLYMKTQYLWDICVYHKTGKFDFCDRIETAKYISKQIEYSEENIDALFYGV